MNPRDAIRASYLARGLSDEEIGLISGIADIRTFDAGEELIRYGERSNDVYVLCDGIVRILTPVGDVLGEIKAGAVVGEIALLDDAPRSATVVARTAGTLAVLPAERLHTLMANRPTLELGLLRNLSRALCTLIRRSNVQLEKFYFMNS